MGMGCASKRNEVLAAAHKAMAQPRIVEDQENCPARANPFVACEPRSHDPPQSDFRGNPHTAWPVPDSVRSDVAQTSVPSSRVPMDAVSVASTQGTLVNRNLESKMCMWADMVAE